MDIKLHTRPLASGVKINITRGAWVRLHNHPGGLIEISDMGVKVLFKRWYVPTCVTPAKLMKLKTSERSKTSCVGFAELHEFSDLHVVCSVTLVVLS